MRPSESELAFEFNLFLVEGQIVQLESDTVDTDPLGNLLRYVYVGGESVNRTLLTSGYATVASFPAGFRYETDFVIAEESARVNSRGVWANLSSTGDQPGLSIEATPTPVPQFSGGTLPALPDDDDGGGVCDYSGTAEAVIKGNIDQNTGTRVYHVPGSLFYSTTQVDEAMGDRWLCTEVEAIAGGWERAKR